MLVVGKSRNKEYLKKGYHAKPFPTNLHIRSSLLGNELMHIEKKRREEYYARRFVQIAQITETQLHAKHLFANGWLAKY